MSLESSSNGYQKTIKDARSADPLIYEFESFRLDPGSLMLYRAGIELPLTPKQVETLLALVERGGAIVPKDDLMERLWPNAFVEESNLVQNIHILRKTLGKTADGRPMIETLHRRGYRFSAEPARIGGEDGVRPSVLQDSTRPGGPDRRRSWLVAGAA